MRLIAIGFLLGCVLLLSLPTPLHWSLSLLFPVVFIFMIRFPQFRLLWALAAGFCWTLMQSSLVLLPSLGSELEGVDVLVTARILSLPEEYRGKTRFLVTPEKLITPELPLRLPDKLRISWYKNRQDVKPGELWRFTLRLKRPHGFANPGGFDYEKWLFSQGVRGTGYVKNGSSAVRLEAASPTIDGFRYTLTKRLQNEMQGLPAAGMISALALGVRSGLSGEDWDTLLKTGTNHLVAISGLHIGLVATLSFWLVNFIWRAIPLFCLRLPAQKAAAAISLFPATAYAMLAGFSVPTQRALIMLLVVVVSLWCLRRIRPASVLSSALVAVLLFDSLAVLSPGFWLSFAAVATILWSVTNASPSRWPQIVRIQFLLILGLMPLTLWFFSQTSVVAPAANLIAVPVVGFIAVPLLLLGVTGLYIYEPVGWFLVYMVEKLLNWLAVFLGSLLQFPFSHWEHTIPNVRVLAVVLPGMVLILAFRGLPGRWLGAIFILPVLLTEQQRLAEGDYEITVLDVGQGLSTVVRTRDHTLVYDTGQKFSDRFNTSDAVLLPFLNYSGVDYIDSLVLSHSDSDHAGSANELRAGIDIRHTLASYSLDNLNPDQWSICKAGQQWQWNGVTFKILHPYDGWSGVDNDLSCVLSVENSTGKTLLTGDISVRAERDLMKRYPDELKSSLVLAPHHGSLTSSSERFIQTVAADAVVFPVGYRNRYGFPKQKVVSRYEDAGMAMYRTDYDGAVQFRFLAEEGIQTNLYRQQQQNLWSAQSD